MHCQARHISYLVQRQKTYEKNFEILGGALKNAQYASSHSFCGSGSHVTDQSCLLDGGAG